MLIRVTNSCRMSCSHCMVDAKPGGRHMDMSVFAATLDFTSRVGVPLLIISGGEPTDHPDIVDMLKIGRSTGMLVSVLSNGMFLGEDAVRRDAILDACDSVQVTNDPRFYPKRVDPFDHPKVVFEDRVRVLSPFGRAKNSSSCTRQAPTCFNLRSIVRATGSLRVAIEVLAKRGRFCSPSVNVDGNVVCGEAPSCSSIGSVNDTLDEISKNIAELQCSRCGLVNNLDKRHRTAIGEGS